MRPPHRRPATVPIVAALVLLACGRDGPRPLVVGQDACDFCRMTLSDLRFGGEIITPTGRIRTFDSVECLAGFAAAAGDSLSAASVWVSDFTSSTLVPAADAHFLMGGSIHSPMGRQVASFRAESDTAALLAKHGGKLLTWKDIVALGRSRAFAASHERAHELVRELVRELMHASELLPTS
ncbi:MAG: nitrous oxide reductase accessory protein NosL [Gemmatimonadaceae bacterium]|nr:nitrous oxide reductase accessory protein NosL [Gemmatimonadaceae bacterium]